MEYTRLGRTGMQVSRICLGCMSYGVAGGIHNWALNEDETRPFIKKALEGGINFFDTANQYASGTSEEFLGRALKEFARREEVVVATKVGLRHPARSERRWPVAAGDHGADRCQPSPPWHGSCRPLSDSPVGL